jgi:O-antigen ligase
LLIAILAGGGTLLALLPYARPVENIPQTIEKYVMRGQTREDLSEASGRQELWIRALESFRETPVLGHGYFMLSRSGTMYVWLKNQYQTAHNLYLHVLTGTGIVGVLLFLWACGTAIGKPTLSPQYFMTLVLTAWFALVGLFELSILGPMDPSTVLFFVTLGATVPALEAPAPSPIELNICEC